MIPILNVKTTDIYNIKSFYGGDLGPQFGLLYIPND